MLYFLRMDSDDFRRRRFLREWTGRIDISHLYQLEQVVEGMNRYYLETQEPRLQYWANTILMIISAVREEMAGYQLDGFDFSGRGALGDEEGDEEPRPKILRKRNPDESD
jgi:hypothetical protein